MSGKFDWEKLNRRRKLDYKPRPRSRPATQPQLDYIVDLAYRKGQPKPKLPKTKQGASDMIERLLAMHDVREPTPVRIGVIEPPKDQSRQEIQHELRQRFPKMTPMTTNSLFQLLAQVDAIGMLFFFDSLLGDENAPQELEELIPYVLRRFTEDFC